MTGDTELRARRMVFGRGPAASLPSPGGGSSAERHRRLFDVARRQSVGVARLVEAHTDAIAILDEGRADCIDRSNLYGVWAAEQPGADVLVDLERRTITGLKPFCTGLGIVDRALITASTPNGDRWLVDVEMPRATSGTVEFVEGGWETSALADTATGSARFADHAVDGVIGEPGFYLDRPGFWHGACGPAACWAGAAVGLADAIGPALIGDDPHRRAHHGALIAAAWALSGLLEVAGDEMDRAPLDTHAGELRARSLRHTVERTCSDMLDRFSRAFGPRPLVTDQATARRVHDLHLYLRQHHAERELGAISELLDASSDSPTGSCASGTGDPRRSPDVR